MNSDNHKHEPGLNGLPAIEQSAAHQADELLAHGLLESSRLDTARAQEDRVSRVMNTIMAEEATTRARLRRPMRKLRMWSAAAAAFVIAGLAIGLSISTEPSASATVAAVVKAMRTAGEQRFEVRLQGPNQDALPSQLHATVDMRAPGMLLLTVMKQDGQAFYVGRDEQGKWAIKRNGQVERRDAERMWPRWAVVEGESVFADSLDKMLEDLGENYTLSRPGAESELNKTADGAALTGQRLVVARKKNPGPGASEIRIWVDAAKNEVTRMELRWDTKDGLGPPPRGGRDKKGGDGPGAERRGPRDERGQGGPGRPDGPRPRPGAGPDGGPRDPEDRPERREPDEFDILPWIGLTPPPPPPPRGGPRGDRPEREDRGPGPGGPGGPDGREDDRGPEMGGPGGPGGGRSPRGPGMGSGPGGPQRGGPGGPGGPGLPGAPDGPGRGRVDQPQGPPKLMVITRVQTAAFEPNWFNPESHATLKKP